ncbi:MAG: hypothetical protein AAFS07_04160 [Pseudomonadota bacterium]
MPAWQIFGQPWSQWLATKAVEYRVSLALIAGLAGIGVVVAIDRLTGWAPLAETFFLWPYALALLLLVKSSWVSASKASKFWATATITVISAVAIALLDQANATGAAVSDGLASALVAMDYVIVVSFASVTIWAVVFATPPGGTGTPQGSFETASEEFENGLAQLTDQRTRQSALHLMRESERMRRLSFVTLGGVAAVLAFAVLVVLFAGLITSIDLSGTDPLANARTARDEAEKRYQDVTDRLELFEARARAFEERLIDHQPGGETLLFLRQPGDRAVATRLLSGIEAALFSGIESVEELDAAVRFRAEMENREEQDAADALAGLLTDLRARVEEARQNRGIGEGTATTTSDAIEALGLAEVRSLVLARQQELIQDADPVNVVPLWLDRDANLVLTDNEIARAQSTMLGRWRAREDMVAAGGQALGSGSPSSGTAAGEALREMREWAPDQVRGRLFAANEAELAELTSKKERAKKDLDAADVTLQKARDALVTEAGGERQTTEALVASAVTRFGVIAVLMFLAQALINLYRYALRLSAFYRARAVTLALADGDVAKLNLYADKLSADHVAMGKEPQLPLEQVKQIAQVLKDLK